ncbi:MAG TPA: thioredoxin domain-containing protein [Desulfobacteraceae bacterium]|nr:thioredoxin domain-containing protein [Desulfobacteraceae bacterium]
MNFDGNYFGEKGRRENPLIHEKSPYLLQHAFNPVDWYGWREEAFEKARKENKPVFLSIGYSTCHWCHVMEKESFEDPEVAQLLNDDFISIKVDREERPDLDHIYMAVCQMTTGSGGWPLTIIMTPDKKPFFAATYIPRTGRFGRPGMMELIPRLAQVWKTRQKEVLESAAGVMRALHDLEKSHGGKELNHETLETGFRELSARFDAKNGGFGLAPKFPMPHNLLFLLRYWKRTGAVEALEMLEKTLQELRRGGIFDQIGYGFHRYSTDREWLVPHFEKMLYDQALLALAYLEGCQATGKAFYGNVAREIFTYVLRDMQSPEGGFYSAEDADSEGVEGKFYLWTEEELRRILSAEEAQFIIQAFNVKEQGNFAEEATKKTTGANILYPGRLPAQITSEFSVQDTGELLNAARKKLFEAREKRIHPHKDDKILTDWNGLMIAALARGARVLEDERYAHAALNAAGFILERMRTPEGRLLHRYREGDADIMANLDDYAFFIWGLLELYAATFDAVHLKTALNLSEILLAHYWDSQNGGFFFTADDGEDLIVRKKEIYDGAIPSGNAVAMSNFFRLARLTGKTEYEEKALGIMKTFSDHVDKFPSGYTQFLCSLDFALGPCFEVIVVGRSGSVEVMKMLNALNSRFIPNHVALFRSTDGDSSAIDEVSEFVKNRVAMDGRATAYVCMNYACREPLTDVQEFLAFLESGETVMFQKERRI